MLHSYSIIYIIYKVVGSIFENTTFLLQPYMGGILTFIYELLEFCIVIINK